MCNASFIHSTTKEFYSYTRKEKVTTTTPGLPRLDSGEHVSTNIEFAEIQYDYSAYVVTVKNKNGIKKLTLFSI